MAGKVATPHSDPAPLAELDRLVLKIFQTVPVGDFPPGSWPQRDYMLLQDENRQFIVPKDEFSLSPLDNLLLETMIKERACDGYSTLLQLFGINLYEKVTALTPFLSEKQIKSLLTGLC